MIDKEMDRWKRWQNWKGASDWSIEECSVMCAICVICWMSANDWSEKLRSLLDGNSSPGNPSLPEADYAKRLESVQEMKEEEEEENKHQQQQVYVQQGLFDWIKLIINNNNRGRGKSRRATATQKLGQQEEERCK